MVTDLSTPKFRCDLCNTDFTGETALSNATECEAHGVTTPLPPETWVLLNGYANSHDLTVGGFKLAQVGKAEIKRSFESGHRIFYRGNLSTEMRDDTLHPHQPGVLNTQGVNQPSLHGGELSSALRETPGAAEDFVGMLALFGVGTSAAEILHRSHESYLLNAFRRLDDKRDVKMLPPLTTLPEAVQSALLAVCSPQDYFNAEDPSEYRSDLAGGHRYTSHHRSFDETQFDMFNVSAGNGALTRARLLTFANTPAEQSAAEWLAGADTHLPRGMLRHDGGDATKGDRRIDIGQRNLLRAAGFTVPWPTRIRNAPESEINTPAKALRAIIDRYEITVKLPESDHTLFTAPVKIGIVSGKGGVGKTTVAAAAGHALAREGNTTLVVDLDFHGPSLGSIFDLPPITVGGTSDEPTIIPSQVSENLYAVSLSQFIRPGSAVTWRSASVEGFLLFLAARLDTLGATHIIFDFPPGTGDVESAVFKNAKPDGIVLVTTGSKLSHDDTRRAATFARGFSIPVLGVVENLSYREVTTPDGEAFEVRLFGEYSDTEAFTAGLAYDNGFGKKWAPRVLTSLPFVSDPALLASTPEFAAITSMIATPIDEFEATGDPAVRTISF